MQALSLFDANLYLEGVCQQEQLLVGFPFK